MSPILLALIFTVLSVGLLVYLCFCNFEDKKIRRFYIAATGVYVSGAVLIFIFSLVFSKLTCLHVIVLHAVILFVYIFDMIILRKIYRGMNDMNMSAVNNEKSDDEKNK